MTNSHQFTAAFMMLLCMIGASCSSSPIAEDCRKFRTGKFRIRNDENGSITLVSRTKTRQIEVKEGQADTLYMAVRWLNDCRYELSYLAGNAKDFTRSHPLTVDITRIEKGYYLYSSQFRDDADIVMKDTVHIAQ